MSERPPLESRMVTADDGSQMIVLWDDSWGYPCPYAFVGSDGRIDQVSKVALPIYTASGAAQDTE